jgi:hypothetical protein
MTDYEKIESYVDDLLNLSGVVNGEGERPVWLLLHHLYCAVAMFSLMNDSERALIKGVQRRLKYFFSFNVSIKQRRRRTEKEILPPVPLTLEKENKEKEEKTTLSAGRALSLPLSDLEKRQNAFKMEIWNHRGNIDMDMLNDFYYYWTDVNPKTQKMRFEEQRYFSVEKRLQRWKKNEISNSIAASKIRLRRTKKRDEQEQTEAEKSQAAAAEREQEMAEREAKTAQSKQEQMLTEDYIREHPDSLMAKIYRQKKKKT